MPKLEARDLRPARLARSSLVLSSGAIAQSDTATNVASLLTVKYCCMPSGSQQVAIRVQRPTVVAEIDFAIALLKYAVPSFALGLNPRPFVDRDIRYGP